MTIVQFQPLGSVSLQINQRLQWIWHSSTTSSYITGDERTAYSLPQNDINEVSRLQPARPFDPDASLHHPCNLPVPDAYYEELRERGWRGFHLLKVSEYTALLDTNGRPMGNLVLTMVFGPDYDHCFSHRQSGLVLALRSGSIKLFAASNGTFTRIGETRTRGRAALTFCAHPTETLVVYGDNYGNFHSHQFSNDGFGKASKIAAKNYKASALEFIDGNILLIGGMGYLETYAYTRGRFSLLHGVVCPVRDFIWNRKQKTIFVNQGIHGVTTYGYSPTTGFSKLGCVQVSCAVNQMAISECGGYFAVTSQTSPVVTAFATTFENMA